MRTVREHAGDLLRTARRHSLCADDAHDAYQRGLEIFLRRASTLEPGTAVHWLHVVVKHEAQAVRRTRQQLVGAEAVDLDARAADALPDVDERVARFDRLARSAEALARLKPQEVRALWLKAQGHSYQEIADTTGWTYTKVNRCLTEGRRAFLRRYAGIEAGDECRRWAPVVSALVDGEATAEQLAAARPHLRRCAGCRATVRELRMAGPGMAGLLPVGLVAARGGLGSAGPDGSERLASLARAAESAWLAVHERASAWALKLQHGAEAASLTKVAAVAASAAALAGGGVVTVHEARQADGRPAAQGRADRAVPAATSWSGALPAPASGAPSSAARPGAAPSSPSGGSAPRGTASEFGGGRLDFAGGRLEFELAAATTSPDRGPSEFHSASAAVGRAAPGLRWSSARDGSLVAAPGPTGARAAEPRSAAGPGARRAREFRSTTARAAREFRASGAGSAPARAAARRPPPATVAGSEFASG